MDWLLEPFSLDFLQRALIAGVLAAVTCSLVGIWVVLRGLALMSDALAHGVLPGIAVSYLANFDLTLGAAASAAVMVGGVTLVGRRSRLPEDTGIGLLFVGMLALGVILVSRGESYFGDLMGFLFGAVLGATTGDLAVQAVAAVIALVASVVLYRPLMVLAFDERKAAVLGLRPRLTRVALLALIALAVVSSFRTVGNLLVFGLLIAPPATASLLARRVPAMMATSVVIGVLAVTIGLLLSYHFDLAAGAAMAGTAVAQFFGVLLVTEALGTMRGRSAHPAAQSS
jgi:ABC-type Mn2+/Zn2+ transport system permease subunit